MTTTSSPPQGCLPLHSAVCNCKSTCRTWTYCSHFANNSFLTWVGPVLAKPKCLGRVRLKKRKKENMLGRDRPNRFGPISAHCFLGLCLAQLSGLARPTCFNNI
jgi:hypothetical protein